jgi:hypothetical protein
MAKERILEMSIDQWAKCTGEVTHRPEVGQQPSPTLQQLSHAIDTRPHGEERQRIGRRGNRTKHIHKSVPLLHGSGAPQLTHHRLKPVITNGNAQVAFGEKHVPGAVRNNLQGLTQGP